MQKTVHRWNITERGNSWRTKQHSLLFHIIILEFTKNSSPGNYSNVSPHLSSNTKQLFTQKRPWTMKLRERLTWRIIEHFLESQCTAIQPPGVLEYLSNSKRLTRSIQSSCVAQRKRPKVHSPAHCSQNPQSRFATSLTVPETKVLWCNRCDFIINIHIKH